MRTPTTAGAAHVKAQGEQIRSVSVERLGPVIGRVPVHQMAQLDDALRIHLQL